MGRDDVDALRNDESGRIGGNDERGNAARPGFRSGAREHAVEVRNPAVRDKRLFAIKHPRVPLPARAGGDRADVGSRFRLRVSLAPDLGAGEDRRQEPLVLLRRAECDQRRREQALAALDTYSGLIVIYLTFSLPFAIWLMVSYFEDVPREMEEAALLDRAGRVRALWYVILPQVRGGIAVTTIFVFLNAWNEFLFAVVLGGNRVRTVTVAMFNFISVEQTLWAKLAAGAVLAMLPVIVLGLVAQRHIVKGLTVGAVKGGGRR